MKLLVPFQGESKKDFADESSPFETTMTFLAPHTRPRAGCGALCGTDFYLLPVNAGATQTESSAPTLVRTKGYQTFMYPY